MKTLILLRHAKSSWKDTDLADFDRPLNDRGRQAAPFIGRLLDERGLQPDGILSSPAKRARNTAELVKDAAGLDTEILLEDRIYEANPNTLLYLVSEANDACSSLMLVGHNPGMEDVIRVLTGESERMPTAAVAVIDLDIDSWKQVAAGVGKLRMVLRPRDEMGSD